MQLYCSCRAVDTINFVIQWTWSLVSDHIGIDLLKNHLETKERSLNDYPKSKLEPTAKTTRCGWTKTYITTCYRFLRRALLCRSKRNNPLASTKDADARKNGTRICANMNCERHAVYIDERCTKHPDTFKRRCSQECYQHAKLNGTLESPTKLTVWAVIPEHAPLPKVKMKVVGNDSNINQRPKETAGTMYVHGTKYRDIYSYGTTMCYRASQTRTTMALYFAKHKETSTKHRQQV